MSTDFEIPAIILSILAGLGILFWGIGTLAEGEAKIKAEVCKTAIEVKDPVAVDLTCRQ